MKTIPLCIFQNGIVRLLSGWKITGTNMRVMVYPVKWSLQQDSGYDKIG